MEKYTLVAVGCKQGAGCCLYLHLALSWCSHQSCGEGQTIQIIVYLIKALLYIRRKIINLGISELTIFNASLQFICLVSAASQLIQESSTGMDESTMVKSKVQLSGTPGVRVQMLHLVRRIQTLQKASCQVQLFQVVPLPSMPALQLTHIPSVPVVSIVARHHLSTRKRRERHGSDLLSREASRCSFANSQPQA